MTTEIQLPLSLVGDKFESLEAYSLIGRFVDIPTDTNSRQHGEVIGMVHYSGEIRLIVNMEGDFDEYTKQEFALFRVL